MVIGTMIGSAKDRGGDGFLLSMLFGPLGVLVTLCLKNTKKEKEEKERKQQIALQLQLQQAQLEKLDHLQRSVPPPPRREPKLRLASGGQDLGEMPVATVKLLLQNGKLSPQDYYFDSNSNEWMQLDCCPELA